jgi:hypothetical protein
LTEALHIAAQYLAAAGKSYLDHQSDDSHTNMGWNSEAGCFHTDPLGTYSDHMLALNLESFSLDFVNLDFDVVETLYLVGTNHIGIVNWIGEKANALEVGELYEFDLHYELPYDELWGDLMFAEPDMNELQRIAEIRTLAVQALDHVKSVLDCDVSIRTWPHHFDTAIAIPLHGGEHSIGLGLAIADLMHEDDYFYASGWSSDGSLSLEDMEEIDDGTWMAPAWNGAVMPYEGDDSQVMRFLLQAALAIQERSAVR